MFSSYHHDQNFAESFRLAQNAFLQTEGLPFADVLHEEEVQAASGGNLGSELE